MTQPRHNAGHGPDAFATRVRMLRQHPEVWRQVPTGVTRRQWMTDPALRQLWAEIAEFLRGAGLLSVHTYARDVNVPKLIEAVRDLESRVVVTGNRWVFTAEGVDIAADVQAMITALRADRHLGPYSLRMSHENVRRLNPALYAEIVAAGVDTPVELLLDDDGRLTGWRRL